MITSNMVQYLAIIVLNYVILRLLSRLDNTVSIKLAIEQKSFRFIQRNEKNLFDWAARHKLLQIYSDMIRIF